MELPSIASFFLKVYFLDGSYVFHFRCATGEAWPDIMLDSASGRPCDPLALEFNKTSGNMQCL